MGALLIKRDRSGEAEPTLRQIIADFEAQARRLWQNYAAHLDELITIIAPIRERYLPYEPVARSRI